MKTSTLITAIQFSPGDGKPRTDIPDQTAYHLHMVGWKPPITRAVTFLDDELREQQLTIPNWDVPLPRRADLSRITVAQIERTIWQRLCARGYDSHATARLDKAVNEAAEAIHDLIGGA